MLTMYNISHKIIIHNAHCLNWFAQFVCMFVIQLFLLCFDASSATAYNRTVTVGLYENEPKVFTSRSGKPSGIFIDIIEYIAKSESWTLRYVPGTWAEGLDRLEKGEIDLMPDVAYTTDRVKLFSFHKVPVLSSWSQVYAPQGSHIKSILDLNGKRIAVLENSIQHETFKRLTNSFGLNNTLIPVPDYKTMFKMVAEGKADAALTNRFFGLLNAKNFRLEETGVIFDPADLYFAASKNASGQLLEAIDKHLSVMKKDTQSIYYRSLKQWTSEDIRFEFPAWLRILGLAAGVVVLMSLAGSFILKQQVNTRTRELQEALQKFADIVEFLPDPTFVVDQNKKIIAWNQACEDITGIKKESLMGLGDYAYAEPFFGERRPVLIDLLDMPTPEIEATYKYVQRKGNKLYAESFIPRLRSGRGAHLWGVAAPLYDRNGRRSGAIETIRDVTEQKHIEEALRDSERKYRELVMLANSIILRWTRDGHIVFMNEFGQRFFGYTESELLGRHVVGTIVPETGSAGGDLHQLMEEITANPRMFDRNINENMRSSGESVWIDWTNKIILDDQGQVKEILSIGSDITERKKAEKDIRRLNDELQRHAEVLEQRVAERTAELAASMGKALAADRIKSAFLATMSHELRTPLNSIIGFTGILLQGLAGTLNPEQKKQMTMVQNSSCHLLALINDVLDISKIEAGQLELSFKSFDLRASIEKMVSLVSPLAQKKDIDLKMDIADDIKTAVSDQVRLEQVILNLLNNAVKFTEQGYVSVSCGSDNDKYILSVKDTGIGMKPEEIPNLFKPFCQIDTGLARKYEGTGLGLSICMKILDMMGGTISVESQWGKGSVFSVSFPKQFGGL